MDSRVVVPGSGRRRVRRGEAQWRALVGEFEASGDSRRGFCARHGISISTFDLWRKRLGSAASKAAASPGAGDGLFVELRAPRAELARGCDASRSAAPGAWEVELQLDVGVVLRLRRGALAC